MFRDYGNDGVTFNESLDWLGKGSYTGKMTNISEINLTSTIDSVGVQITSPKTIKVNIASWGSWFWRKGAGLSGSESDRYKVVPGDLSFEVTVKDSVPGRIFIFNKGEKWQSVVAWGCAAGEWAPASNGNGQLATPAMGNGQSGCACNGQFWLRQQWAIGNWLRQQWAMGNWLRQQWAKGNWLRQQWAIQQFRRFAISQFSSSAVSKFRKKTIF
ncbi:MAG: hypothetical protein IPN72_22950 [Saprospiraceae bacterium]|nr:hypothetical protein [Saprospiraceae bacterium]